MADETPLRLLIDKTIERPAMHGLDNGEVDVASRNDPEGYIYAGSDSDAGVPATQRERGFQHFERLGAPEARETRRALAAVADTAPPCSRRISLKSPESGQGLLIESALPRAHALAGG